MSRGRNKKLGSTKKAPNPQSREPGLLVWFSDAILNCVERIFEAACKVASKILSTQFRMASGFMLNERREQARGAFCSPTLLVCSLYALSGFSGFSRRVVRGASCSSSAYSPALSWDSWLRCRSAQHRGRCGWRAPVQDWTV